DASIAAADIANGAVTLDKVAANAVNSAKIVDGSIVAADLADGAVTSAKILDGTIAAADLAANSVTTAKIADANVTSAKIQTSPALTGTPTAPTAAAGTNTAQIATTAFVKSAMAAAGDVTSTGGSGACTWYKVAAKQAFPSEAYGANKWTVHFVMGDDTATAPGAGSIGTTGSVPSLCGLPSYSACTVRRAMCVLTF
ncbi:MAG: hypothetical protein LBO74_08420, partial [Candidatus Symbiothrix sp.]|nr:hypothetical protein [Candidatus Symbiothrix sp.]